MVCPQIILAVACGQGHGGSNFNAGIRRSQPSSNRTIPPWYVLKTPACAPPHTYQELASQLCVNKEPEDLMSSQANRGNCASISKTIPVQCVFKILGARNDFSHLCVCHVFKTLVPAPTCACSSVQARSQRHCVIAWVIPGQKATSIFPPSQCSVPTSVFGVAFVVGAPCICGVLTTLGGRAGNGL